MSVPADEKAWSARLKVYFKALNQYHARRKETRLGIIMITNLSGFPSSLTVIHVPDGAVRRHRNDFVVNENLKRLGCSGRVGLTLNAPSDATQSKFHQLFHTSDKIPLESSVIELVKLCQAALVLFGILEPEYADGLLCDVTEKAANEWWIDIGVEHYNTEPRDGVLGPMTVAAMLGLLMGARNRLNVYGAPVSKDVFDIEATRHGINYFQKSQRLPKTRKLDRQTLDRLHRVTAKAASGEGWTVPRAVKSTVAELSGKGGDMINSRDKVGIAEVETFDIEVFIQMVDGEKGKWLWHGKPRKSVPGDKIAHLSEVDGPGQAKDEQGQHRRIGRRRELPTDENSLRRKGELTQDDLGNLSAYDDNDAVFKRTTLKKATERMTDGPRSGIGRIKSAVGRKGLQLRQYEDDPNSPQNNLNSNNASPLPGDAIDDRFEAKSENIESSLKEDMDSPYLRSQRIRPASTKDGVRTPAELEAVNLPESGNTSTVDGSFDLDHDSSLNAVEPSHLPRDGLQMNSLDNQEEEMKPKNGEPEPGPLLLRSMSHDEFNAIYQPRCVQEKLPRHLSFSTAAKSILTWEPLAYIDNTVDRKASKSRSNSFPSQLRNEITYLDEVRQMQERVTRTSYQVGAWVTQQIAQVQVLDSDAAKTQQMISEMYHPNAEEFRRLKDRAEKVLAQEESELQEMVRSVEMLGAKLEYEINSLRSKVEDVEDTVFEFERQVFYVEARMRDLENDIQMKKEGWFAWLVRMVLGLGRAS